MLLLRLAGFFAAIVIAAGIVLWMVTGNRRYLRLAGRVTKGVLAFVVIVLALMFLERLILI